MNEKKRSKIGLAIFGTALGALAIFGASKLFPKMKEQCRSMCEKMKAEGAEPPAIFKKIMEKCCGSPSEEKTR